MLKELAKTANLIAAIFGNLFGDKAIDKIFTIPSEFRHRPEQIRYILSGAEDIDNFVVRLAQMISVHKKYFGDEKFDQRFNGILNNLHLRLDDSLYTVKT